MAGIRINSNNFNGKSVEITFNPFSGGTINLGTQTIPYDYVSSNYEGNYSIYIPEFDKTCPLQVGTAPTPTPTITPTSSITPTPTISITPSITSTPTPTPSSSEVAFDADAAAYLADVIASGGTTDATISAATNTLFTSLKSNGLYSKMKAMWPYVGATASSHSINALLDKTFDITWNGGMTHGVSGSTGNGTNGYGNTNFSKNDMTAYNDYSFGGYQNTPLGTATMISVFNSNNKCQLGANLSGTDWFARSMNNSQLSTANSGNITGNYIVNRDSSDDTAVYRNATEILSATQSPLVGADSQPFYVFNTNVSGSPGSNYGTHTMCFAFVGEGLTTSEITAFDGIINDFQTSLGRNTYT